MATKLVPQTAQTDAEMLNAIEQLERIRDGKHGDANQALSVIASCVLALSPMKKEEPPPEEAEPEPPSSEAVPTPAPEPTPEEPQPTA